MNRQIVRAAAAAVVVMAGLAAGTPPALAAGAIETACRASGRTGDAALCSCIQRAADATLDRQDQRNAARFFADPHRAQEVRMSSRTRDSAFWERYLGFAARAEATCGAAG